MFMSLHSRGNRKPGLHLLLCTFIFLAFGPPLQAQENTRPPIYIGCVFIKLQPQKFATYDSLLKTYTKKVFDDEIKKGNYMSWQMYQVLSPSGSQSEYDIVGVVVSTKMDMLLDPPGNDMELFKKSFPKMSDAKIAETFKSYASSRSIVKREIYTQLSSTNDDGPPTKSPAKYLQVDFMTPQEGKRADYVKLESETFKPVHKERIKLGALTGWTLLEKIMPGDSQDPAPFVTVNFYDNLNGMMDGKYDQAIKAAHPNVEPNKLFNDVNVVKKRQRIEVWKLLATDSVQGATAAK
jgi:hypothetical protein